MRFSTLIVGTLATIVAAAPVPAEQAPATDANTAVDEHANPILPLGLLGGIGLGAANVGLGIAGATAANIGVGLARGGLGIADRIGDRIGDFGDRIGDLVWGRDEPDYVLVQAPPPGYGPAPYYSNGPAPYYAAPRPGYY